MRETVLLFHRNFTDRSVGCARPALFTGNTAQGRGKISAQRRGDAGILTTSHTTFPPQTTKVACDLQPQLLSSGVTSTSTLALPGSPVHRAVGCDTTATGFRFLFCVGFLLRSRSQSPR